MSEQLLTTPNLDDAARTEDLQDLQIHINLATQDVRSHGEAFLPRLNQLLSELGDKLQASDGLYVVGLPIGTPRATVTDKALEASYSLGVDNHDNPVLYIPKSCITAHQVNPRFYGNGHDVSPVIDLRVLREPGQPAYDSDGQYVKDTEMWYQISLDTASLALSYEPAAQAA